MVPLRDANESLATRCDRQLSSVILQTQVSHSVPPRIRNDTTHVNLAARQWLPSYGLFCPGHRQLPSRDRQGNNAFPCNNAAMEFAAWSEAGCYGQKEKAFKGGNRDEASASK